MLFVITGGTIDKMPVYLADGKTFDQDSKVFGDTHLPEMLGKIHHSGQYSVNQLFMVDSFDMTDDLRSKISSLIEGTKDDQIIVTHGTSTMPETARFLKKDKRLSGKTIVLTGAMLPYSIGEDSDALFNLGNAVEYVQSLPAGVYVAMNGTAFDAENVRKDVKAGVFRTLK